MKRDYIYLKQFTNLHYLCLSIYIKYVYCLLLNLQNHYWKEFDLTVLLCIVSRRMVYQNNSLIICIGRVTNIPAGMVTDQFGMVGLLTFIRAAESDPKLVSLALGCDLMTLGLNLNTSE